METVALLVAGGLVLGYCIGLGLAAAAVIAAALPIEDPFAWVGTSFIGIAAASAGSIAGQFIPHPPGRAYRLALMGLGGVLLLVYALAVEPVDLEITP